LSGFTPAPRALISVASLVRQGVEPHGEAARPGERPRSSAL